MGAIMKSAIGTDRHTPTGVRGRVAAMLRQGLDIASCARVLGMPVDFVRQIAESLEAQGAIDLVTWRGSHGCATGGCTPDPDSPLCAGCPLKPVQLRRHRSAQEADPSPRAGLWRRASRSR
ncbi:hypothetical protein ACLUWS_02215 [Bifidobacterium boum]|uniref:hypothetical protein n=1 Tax=Bifidobacterium boum TaxID=78343 RepID=UPI0039919FC7